MVTVRERVRIFTPELQLRTRTGQGCNSASEAEARVGRPRPSSVPPIFLQSPKSLSTQPRRNHLQTRVQSASRSPSLTESAAQTSLLIIEAQVRQVHTHNMRIRAGAARGRRAALVAVGPRKKERDDALREQRQRSVHLERAKREVCEEEQVWWPGYSRYCCHGWASSTPASASPHSQRRARQSPHREKCPCAQSSRHPGCGQHHQVGEPLVQNADLLHGGAQRGLQHPERSRAATRMLR